MRNCLAFNNNGAGDQCRRPAGVLFVWNNHSKSPLCRFHAAIYRDRLPWRNRRGRRRRGHTRRPWARRRPQHGGQRGRPAATLSTLTRTLCALRRHKRTNELIVLSIHQHEPHNFNCESASEGIASASAVPSSLSVGGAHSVKPARVSRSNASSRHGPRRRRSSQ